MNHRSFQKNILVVDDDDSILDLVSHTLSRLNCEVFAHASPVAAFEFLQESALNISVIILDWNMPGITGIDLLRRIKKIDRLKYIPVIMLTGRSEPDDIRQGIDAGAFYYLTKPFNQKVLSTLIRSAINHFARLESLQYEVEEGAHISQTLQEGRFEFSTFEQAERLSRWLTHPCPDSVGARLGLHELLVNAIEHGNLQITYDEKSDLISRGKLHEEITRRLSDPEYGLRRVVVDYVRTPEYVEFMVTDMGRGFEYSAYLNLSPERAYSNHGRGIAMANSMSFAELEYFPPGNRVRARVYLVPQPEQTKS